MKSKPTTNDKNPPPPATQSDDTKKGYNEKNPTQPGGAFKPDAATTKAKPPKKEKL